MGGPWAGHRKITAPVQQVPQYDSCVILPLRLILTNVIGLLDGASYQIRLRARRTRHRCTVVLRTAKTLLSFS